MGNKSNAILQDSGMERAVLAGIIARGSDCFFEVEDILRIKDFYWLYNQEVFAILTHLVHEQDVKTFDLPNIQAVAKILGFDNFVGGGKHSEYLVSLTEEVGSSEDNIKKLVVVIYKFSLARRGYMAAQKIQHDLKSITGAENVDEIISKIEEPVFKFTSDIMDQGANVVSLGQKFEEAMKTLSKTPQDIVGLPTGFPMWDEAIGGGLRPATVSIVGARPKQAKSFFCMNVARNIAENNIPVLYLDTELTSDTQLHRLTSLVTKVELNHVETGQFVNNHHESDAIWGCEKHIQELTIDHFSVAGMSPQAIISTARRWLSRTVGFTDSGAAKPCLVIYDYIKLMNDGGFKNNIQEYQLLGFLITALHNFAVKFKLPVLATVQLNKDGVGKEASEVVSGSDRIVWLCSNFTILKPKSQTELNEDPQSNGTKKLIVTATRYGSGMESGEYINIIDELSVGKLSEGKPFSLIVNESLENQAIEQV